MFAIALLPLLASPGAPSLLPARDYLLALTPGDAFAVVTLDDADGVRTGLAKNSWLRFARDAEVAGLIDHLRGSLGDEIGGGSGPWNLEALDHLGIEPQALFEALSGSAVLFAEIPGIDPDEMSVGLLVEIGEDRAAFDELLGGLLEKARKEAVVRGEEHAGVPLTVVEAPQGDQGTVVMAELGDVVALVGGADGAHVAELARGIVDRWAGASEGESLLEDETYRSARSHASFGPQIEAFVDLGTFWEVLEKTGELASEDIPEELFDELRRLGWVHLSGRLSEGETADLQVALGAPAEGLLGAFSSLLGGVPSDLLKRIPRNATTVSTMSLDLQGASALIEDLAREFHPETYQGMQTGLSATEVMGVDVREDVLGQLTGEMATFAVEVPARESALGAAAGLLRGLSGGSPLPTYGRVFMLGVRDAEGIEELLAGLTESENAVAGGTQRQELYPREVHGQVVHRLEVFQDFVPVNVHWSATPGALLVSLQPSALNEALRMSTEEGVGIRENRAFSTILEENRRASVLRISDSAACLKAMIGMCESLGPALKLASALSGKKLDQGLPFGPDVPWPDAAVVDRYFGGVTFASFAWSDGALRAHIASR